MKSSLSSLSVAKLIILVVTDKFAVIETMAMIWLPAEDLNFNPSKHIYA